MHLHSFAEIMSSPLTTINDNNTCNNSNYITDVLQPRSRNANENVCQKVLTEKETAYRLRIRTTFVFVTQRNQTRHHSCTMSRVPNPHLLDVRLAEINQFLDSNELWEAFWNSNRSCDYRGVHPACCFIMFSVYHGIAGGPVGPTKRRYPDAGAAATP